MNNKRRPELPVIVATSPWLKEQSCLPVRIVLRRVKTREYAVHREFLENGASGYCWGYYFAWSGRTKAAQIEALKRAWKCFVSKADPAVLGSPLEQTVVVE